MKVRVSTAFAFDLQEEANENTSYYPMIGDLPSIERSRLYLQCTICMFATLDRVQADFEKCLFTNQPNFISDIHKNLLEKYGVEIIKLPFNIFEFKDSPRFKNAFYKLDVIDHLGKRNDNYYNIILDNDVVWHNISEDLRFYIEENIPLAYNISELAQKFGNRKSLKKKFEKLNLNDKVTSFDWFGGEFLAGNCQAFSVISNTLKDVYLVVAQNDKHQEFKTNDEWVSSYSINKHRFELGLIHDRLILQRYIGTINIIKPKNVQIKPEFLEFCCIWHLPGEKKDGFKKLYNLLEKDVNLLKNMTSEKYTEFLARTMNIYPSKYKIISNKVIQKARRIKKLL